jgi:hypothetical protein
MIAGSSPGPPPATAAWQHNAHGYAYTNAPAQHSAVPAQHVPVAREALLTDARIAGSSQLNANDERNHRPMNQVWQLYLSWKIASSPWYDRPFKVFSCDALSIHVILPADRHEQCLILPAINVFTIACTDAIGTNISSPSITRKFLSRV